MTCVYVARCNVGYYGYPRCVPCQCHVNGTQGQVCEVGGGQCPCKPNFDGFNCDQCAYGYYNFPSCTRQLSLTHSLLRRVGQQSVSARLGTEQSVKVKLRSDERQLTIDVVSLTVA